MSERFTIAALRAELLTDPAQLGYAGAVSEGDQNELVLLVNMARAGGGYQVNRAPVTPSEVFASIDSDDFLTLTTTDLARLQVILTVPRIDLSAGRIRAMVANVFQTGSATRQELAALQMREGSRAEVLWGAGKIVTLNEIDQALRNET